MTDEEVLDLLRAAARAVGDAVRGHARRGPSGRRDTQYHADVVADEAMLGVLVPAGITVVSEESGRTEAGPLVCVADPIDGSTNFDRGIPYYATSLCVLDDGQPRCGLVVNHAADTWYTAVRGVGAWRDGAPIRPSGAESLGTSIVACAGLPVRNPGWSQFRVLGAAALELCAVGDGSLDAFVVCRGFHLRPWDYLAGMLVCEEAGGVVRELDGRELIEARDEPRRLLAAASPALADRLGDADTAP